MYKNIVFDFGGVMVDFDPTSTSSTCSERGAGRAGLRPDLRQQRMAAAGRRPHHPPRPTSGCSSGQSRGPGLRGAGRAGRLDEHAPPPPRCRRWCSSSSTRLLRLLPEQHPRGRAGPADARDFRGSLRRRCRLLRSADQQARPPHLSGLLDKYHLRRDECIFIDDRPTTS